MARFRTGSLENPMGADLENIENVLNYAVQILIRQPDRIHYVAGLIEAAIRGIEAARDLQKKETSDD